MHGPWGNLPISTEGPETGSPRRRLISWALLAGCGAELESMGIPRPWSLVRVRLSSDPGGRVRRQGRGI